MIGSVAIGLTGMMLALQSQPAPTASSGSAPSIVDGFKLLSGTPSEAPTLRFDRGGAIADDRRDDRLAADRWAIPPSQRPREPGSAVDARMSMRLDRDAGPSFGMGGIGRALLRVTEALTD